MSGPSVHQHAFPKKRFQAAVVAAIDQHAAAISQLADRVEAQGGVLADLATDRDAAKQALASLEKSYEFRRDQLVEVSQSFYGFRARSFVARFRWLFTGR